MRRGPKSPQTLDNATGLPVPTPRRIDLKTLEQVRQEMGRVYRDMRERRIDSQDGSRLVYVLSQIARVVELVEIESRLKILEARHGNGL